MKKQKNMSQDELKKMRRFSYIKMAAMIGIIAAVFAFSSIAWFTMSREVEGSGMQMTAQGVPFTIEFPGTDEGKWIQQYMSLPTKTGVWLLTADDNLDNDTNVSESEQGLEPGDSGTLQFRIAPYGSSDSILVDLCFSLRAIEKPQSGSGSSTPVEISDPDIMHYLASHIMLFTGIDENGKYTGLIPIESADDLNRYWENQTFSTSDTGYRTLYWVWPLHLKDLISDQDSELIYAPSERDDVIDYIVEHKTGYFKNITTGDDQLAQDLDLLNSYNTYSQMFDRADIEIGRNVQFVILGLSATPKN